MIEQVDLQNPGSFAQPASQPDISFGSLARDRRLGGDPYDPQRPGLRKRSGWSAVLLHRFIPGLFSAVVVYII